MGMLYSSHNKPAEVVQELVTLKTTQPLPVTTRPDRHLTRAVEDVQRLSPQDMEMEFERIHERSSQILKSLRKNPCEELTVRITQCLEDNSNEMAKCFSAMDQYRLCINEQVADKLLMSADH